MGIFSRRNLSSRNSERALWASLVFSFVGGLSACSSTVPDSEIPDASQTTEVNEGMNTTETSSVSEENSSNSNKVSSGIDSRFGTRKAPEVREKPFQADDQWMNAFYFVRSPNENWESLSQMIYGRPDRGDILASWNNKGTLAVGRVIYYNSAARPTDQSSMKVFAEDFGIGLQQVEVKVGESLSQIAQSLYGSPMSWKEIAALNPDLNNPDILRIGQKLVVQPAQMDTKGAIDQLVTAAKQNGTESPTSTASEAPAGDTETAAASDDAEMAALDKEPVEAVTEQSSNSEGSSSNLLMMVGAGILVVGLIALLVRRRILAKRASGIGGTETWDENGNVTKLTRPKTGF